MRPTSDTKSGKDPSPGEFHFDDEFDIFGVIMSRTGPSSPIVKDEPEDWFQGANMAQGGHQGNNRNHQGMNFHPEQSRFGVMAGSIDPSELSTQSGSFGMAAFSPPGNSMAGSFPPGNSEMPNSVIGNDELHDLGNLNEATKMSVQLNTNMNGAHQDDFGLFAEENSVPQQRGAPVNQLFTTHTPNGDPIQSPWLNNGGFNYQGYHPQMAQHMSPHMRAMGHTQIMTPDPNYRARASLSHMMDRKHSDSRSPLTPKTPAQNGFDMTGTPDSHSGSGGLSLPHRHQTSLSGRPWDGSSDPASLHSMHSPIVSPATHPGHAPFSEVMKSAQHAGSPGSKMDPASASVAHPGVQAYQTQEAKRRRRRESHNMVERRRRDNINERIQELSHLVPAHRLEDEKLRKHLAANGPNPLSPTLAGISSPGSSAAATSLLAAQGGRRATGAGNITLGIPPDDKDKGPNKGDILNGSVSWTRDLMWALHRSLGREDRLRAEFARCGEAWPFGEEDDNDRRMRSELLEAIEANGEESFGYSRGRGSGLRVPGHTNLHGDSLPGVGGNGSDGGTVSPQSLSPSAAPGNAGQYWGGNNGAGSVGLGFKGESDYDMQLN